MSKSFVVVTGGSGFIASHIIAQLLEAGYAVRTTVRNIEQKSPLIEQMLHQAGITDLCDLSLVAADLTNPAHSDDAINGADYVIHPASPTPTLNFKDERTCHQRSIVCLAGRCQASHQARGVNVGLWGDFCRAPRSNDPFH